MCESIKFRASLLKQKKNQKNKKRIAWGISIRNIIFRTSQWKNGKELC